MKSFQVAKMGCTRAIVYATCNATFVALQVAGKIASCNMAFTTDHYKLLVKIITCVPAKTVPTEFPPLHESQDFQQTGSVHRVL